MDLDMKHCHGVYSVTKHDSHKQATKTVTYDRLVVTQQGDYTTHSSSYNLDEVHGMPAYYWQHIYDTYVRDERRAYGSGLRTQRNGAAAASDAPTDTAARGPIKLAVAVVAASLLRRAELAWLPGLGCARPSHASSRSKLRSLSPSEKKNGQKNRKSNNVCMCVCI
jgi:hypothetical protein